MFILQKSSFCLSQSEYWAPNPGTFRATIVPAPSLLGEWPPTVCGPVFFRQSWSAFWLELWELFSALRRHAFCCQEIFFSWSEWNAERLLCTCKDQQHARPELHPYMFFGTRGCLIFQLCCEYPWASHLSETVNISCILHLPFVSLPMHPFTSSALFILPLASFPTSLLMSKIHTSFHKRPWNLVQKYCQSCTTK